MKVVYFQPPGISPKYCEVGAFLRNDSEYIHYMHEPCKILASLVKIVAPDKVKYCKKEGCYVVSDK